MSPSRSEGRITEEPQEDASDEEEQCCNFLEAHGAKLVVFIPNVLAQLFFFSFISVCPVEAKLSNYSHLVHVALLPFETEE